MQKEYMEEKRKHPRLDLGLDVTYFIPARPSEIFKARLVNISSGGLRISDMNHFEDATLVVASIPLPGGDKPILATTSQVWSREINSPLIDKGLRFIEISEHSF